MKEQHLKELLYAGGVLANLAYNMAQDKHVPEEWRKQLDHWRKEWDSALDNYKYLSR